MKTRIIKSVQLPLMVFFFGLSFALTAQPPPPPDSGGNNNGNKLNGGGAPIGGGLFVLLALGVVYGGKKVYDLKKENLEE